jgi:hypothetical protein
MSLKIREIIFILIPFILIQHEDRLFVTYELYKNNLEIIEGELSLNAKGDYFKPINAIRRLLIPDEEKFSYSNY